MSYHRGGHPGAVAVSYSTSTMSPLSPSRRYSGSAGSATGGTSGTNSGSTSKYSTYRSSTSSASSNLSSERDGGYYSSPSITGYRGGSYASSTTSETFRRPYFSPARSVSSYNETSSIVGSSTISGSVPRYGSASSSSASSTASSTSSCTSRDRNSHHTPGSLATTAADLYALYSPTHYVPNIHGSSSTNSGKINNHWRASSTSSGLSSSCLAELHGGDEYDSCRERRDRSYSSENSSGVTSNNGITSNNVGSSSVDRWSTRREAAKRRTPINGSGQGIIGNGQQQEKLEGVAASIEVTPVTRNDSSITSFVNEKYPEIVNNRRSSTNQHEVTKVSTSSIKNGILPINEELDDRNFVNERIVVTTRHDNDDFNVTRDVDNNNEDDSTSYVNVTISNGNDNDRDSLNSDNLDIRRRRRRLVNDVSNVVTNGDEEPRRDGNNDRGTCCFNNTVRLNRDNRDDNNIRERTGNIIDEGSTSVDSRGNDRHHQRQRHDRTSVNELTRVNEDVTIPVLTSRVDRTIDNNVSSLSNVTSSSSSSSASSLSSASPTSETSSPIFSSPCYVSPTILVTKESSIKNEEKDCLINDKTRIVSSNVDDNIIISSKTFLDKNDRGVDKGGDDSAVAGGDADHHRTAYTWTKIPTNPDNTELLTNNAQDREVLGILETRNEGRTSRETTHSTGMRIHERGGNATSVKGPRKSLLWTATNEIEDELVTRSENISVGRVVKENDFEISVVENGDENSEVTNGFENNLEKDEINETRNYDLDETNGVAPLLRNGVKPSGNRSDETGKASTSRRTLFGWNDPIDDLTGPSSSASAASSIASSSASANNSIPVAVHQNLYRGINEQIDESGNSRPPRSRLLSRRDERYGLNGLRNIGNTCFMNSVIQCLSNTRPLLEYLLNEQHLHDINTTTSSMKGALIKAFGQVIHELWEISGDHVVNTTALKSQIQRFAPRFMGYSQQDAQEFLRYLLEGLHEDVNRVTVKPQPILTDIPDHYSDSHKASESWKRYLRSEDSTIVDVFVGQLRSSLHCTSCDHVSVTLDPFWDLSLPIPSRSGTVKLNQCLEHFTKVETLDGDEKPTCSKCQMRRKCTKSFSIQKFPKILVIHLKRFSPTERFRGKLSVLVDFPLTCLDLSAFAAPGVQGCTYNLYGVANHSGTTYSGHYTAYCKHPYSGEWHEYNDSRVSSVPARSVVSSEAYVLFYEQQPPSSHL